MNELLFQTDMMTRAELAFSALDRDKKGYITAKELMKLTKKLSKEELMCLMAKVTVTVKQDGFNSKPWTCVDTDFLCKKN